LKFKSTYSILAIGLSAFVMLLFAGCSTKKNTWINRNYHNLNAKFNGYFNGNEALKEAVTVMEDNYKDDYSKVLPVYTYGDQKDAKTATPAMEKVFKKASFVIQRHSMSIKGQEFCSWIDDTYLMIGQSHFYKHEYFAGVEVFEYVISEYKKQEGRFEALLWLIKTYNEIGAFTKSQGYIDMLKSDPGFPYRLNGELMAVQADFYSKQENYEQAAKYMNRAIGFTKRKKSKARYTFILAQMYQRLKKYDLSRNLYGKVIKMNPKYELTFYAKIYQAKMYDASSGDSRQILAQLNKMLKDTKNSDYLDQIYYGLAEIAIKDGSIAKAEGYLLKSIQKSTTNTQQKGISSVKLADLYFEIPKYPLAGAYYDSAVSFLNKDYPEYEIVLNKKKSLSRLISDYNTINKEDSLQRMAKLSDAELDKMIKNLMQKAIEDEEKAKEDAENAAFNAANSTEINNGATKDLGSGSSWYFYNQQQLTFGFSEFQKRWGTRKLEDNWRRSNKQVMANFIPEDGDTSNAKQVALVDTSGPTKSKTWYTKNLPLTKEKTEASTLKIVEAYYDLGLIYKEQLMDLSKAASTFETLNQKYPGNKYEATCYYQLYRLYLALKDNANAEINKNLILSKYPDSDYAQILRNPMYNAEKTNRLNKIEAYYEETYLAYTDGNYTVALDRCNAADTLIAKSKFKPKFALLKSLCIGRLKPISEFELSLKQVVADYPKDSVKIRAEEILAVINKLKFGDKAPAPIDSASTKVMYKPGPNKTHFFVLAFDTKDVNTEQQSVAVSDFNTKYFESKNYKSNYMPFGKNKGMIVVRLFKNSTEALQYFTTTQSDDDIYKNLEVGTYSYFVISDENYNVLFKEQDTVKYVEFFAQNYKPE
jgi:tetratricopeptide (TPR) repeat protein